MALYKKQRDAILKALANGMTKTDACKMAGVSRDWIYKHMKKDKKFKQEVVSAELNNKLKHIDNIQKAGKESWQASAWWLERKYSEEFGKREDKPPMHIENAVIMLPQRNETKTEESTLEAPRRSPDGSTEED